ncbi:MAG: CTP synthase [Victivallaceae bacterium]
MTKFIFLTGGVVSSLGKGITAASLALLLKRRGINVAMQKLDPYFNVDPGTMSPHQHGEVFVTADGTEADLDLGHYERFTGIPCNRNSNYTSGRIYKNVIERERRGGYLGATVQVIPHITNEIKDAFRSAAAPGIDVAIIEIGGTAGDIESLPFLEAARQFKHEIGPGNAIFIHLTLLPYLRCAGELKTKPSQQSVGILRNIGIFPDILVCRTEVPAGSEALNKLSMFCNVPSELVIEERDIQHSIYEVPLELAERKFDEKVLKLLNLPLGVSDLADWEKLVRIAIHPSRHCRIGVVGKYTACPDSYKSIAESLRHAGIGLDSKVDIDLIDAGEVDLLPEKLKLCDGILIPGGFGSRGLEGKIAAIEFARRNRVPILGICLGMQCMVIEFARNVLGYADADSTEVNPDTSHPVIDLMPYQKNISAKGGTMRLGSYVCELKPASRAAALYGQETISERHRHRYEFNNLYREDFATSKLKIAGTSPDGTLVEMVELEDHPYFIGCQFHPEFQSQIATPHPLFMGLIEAALQYKEHNHAQA